MTGRTSQSSDHAKLAVAGSTEPSFTHEAHGIGEHSTAGEDLQHELSSTTKSLQDSCPLVLDVSQVSLYCGSVSVIMFCWGMIKTVCTTVAINIHHGSAWDSHLDPSDDARRQ